MSQDPSHPSAPTSLTYSECIYVFPTCQWEGFNFPYPPIPNGDITRKSIWAMRAASERWSAAIKRQSTDGLDTVDFGVAVFAKAMEVWVYPRRIVSGIALTCRERCARQYGRSKGKIIRSTAAWLRVTNGIIDWSLDLVSDITSVCVLTSRL